MDLCVLSVCVKCFLDLVNAYPSGRKVKESSHWIPLQNHIFKQFLCISDQLFNSNSTASCIDRQNIIYDMYGINDLFVF